MIVLYTGNKKCLSLFSVKTGQWLQKVLTLYEPFSYLVPSRPHNLNKLGFGISCDGKTKKHTQKTDTCEVHLHPLNLSHYFVEPLLSATAAQSILGKSVSFDDLDNEKTLLDSFSDGS